MQSENECGFGDNTWDYALYVWTMMKHYIGNGAESYLYWNPVLEPVGRSTWGDPQNAMVTVDPANMHDQLQSARMYAHDMIGNFNAGMNTFLDWNVALDHQGGPNHAQNFCDAPILCNVESGTFEKRLSYYYIWHFSHFVSPGARHISTTTFSPEVEAAAFRNPDGRIVAVLTNQTPSPRRVFLRLAGSIIELLLEADSIASVIID